MEPVKSVELVLRESEKRYRELFENSVAGVFRTTIAGKILDCNESYVRIFDYTKEEILKEGVQTFYFAIEDRQAYIRQLELHSVVKNLQLRLRKKNGGEVLVLVNATLKREEGQGEGVIEGTILDITGHIRASSALQESERALSTLMNNLPGMAYRCKYDSDWTMLFVSNGCKELTGYDPEELLNNKKRSFSSIVHEDDKGVGSIQIKQAFRDKNNFEIEYRIIHADGKPRWVWEKGEGIYNEKGEVVFIEGFITDVTERKNFEISQEESRRMYKNLIESSPEGLFVHNFTGNILFTNEKAVRLMGAKGQSDFIGKNVLSYSLAEDAPMIKRRKASLLKGEELGYLESRVKRNDGAVIVIETKPILIDFQGEKAALVFVRDHAYHQQLEKEVLRAQFAEETNLMLQDEIAERKNSERMLRETQKYTRLLIDSSLDMICASDKEGLLTEFNTAAQKTFGYTPEEVLGKHVSMLYATPEDRIRIAEEHLYKTGAYSGEVPNRKKNGELFQTFLSASVLKNDKGEVIGAMGVSRDITEFKKNAERIRESEDRYRAIYRQAFVGIALVDINGRFLQVNQKLAEMFGYSEEELLRFNSRDITHKEDLEVGLKEKEMLIRGKTENYAAEKRYIAKDGRIVYTNLLVSLVRDTKGKPQHTVAVYEDITERKKKEESIQQSLKEKEVLLKEVHHRVKNNLQVITSILSLQSAYVKDKNTLMMLRESQDRIKSMAFIHESLYQTKDFSNVNFSEYVVNLSKNLLRSYDISGRKVELVSQVENVQLNLDQSIPCGLIINELVSNALKYAFRKKKKGIITLKIKEKDEKVSVVLADNGDGIPKGFDYKNTDSLGLQLVVTLTEQLNGTIKLDRKKGTKFTVTFKKMIKKQI